MKFLFLSLMFSCCLACDFADYLFKEKKYFEAYLEYTRCLFNEKQDPGEILKLRLQILNCYILGGKSAEALLFTDSLSFLYADSKEINLFISYQRAKILYQMKKYRESEEECGKLILEQKANNAEPVYVQYNDSALLLKTLNIIQQTPVKYIPVYMQRLSENCIDQELRSKYLTAAHDIKNQRYLRKYPVLSGALSIIPGLGQIYNQRYSDALRAFLVNGLSGALTFYMWKKELSVKNPEARRLTLPIVLSLTSSSFYLANIFNAVNTARQNNFKMEVKIKDSALIKIDEIILSYDIIMPVRGK